MEQIYTLQNAFDLYLGIISIYVGILYFLIWNVPNPFVT